MPRTRLVLPSLFLLFACSPAPIERATTARDPSSTTAAEGIDPVSAFPTSTAPVTGTTWECPMHPEVTSDHAGACPKCTMKLVPKK